MQLIRYRSSTGASALGIVEGERLLGTFATIKSVDELLGLSLAELRAQIEEVIASETQDQQPGELLAPLEGETEVWAAGVTYKRSEEARMEESETPDIYTKVYRASRPELFFKATARRVAGPNMPIAIRADSDWNVPEPELVLVVNAHAEIIGYTIGNDVSSRSIEGENPLYLPQAKVYMGSCALGPAIIPVWEIDDPYTLGMRMWIERAGSVLWEGETNTRELNRKLDDLVSYLFREDAFPAGVLLCTGTALVPDSPFSLEAGDTVHIVINKLGELYNSVVRGKSEFLKSKRLETNS